MTKTSFLVLVASTTNKVYVFDLDGNLLWDRSHVDSRAVGDFVISLVDKSTISISAMASGKAVADYTVEQDARLSHLHAHGSKVFFVGGRGESEEEAAVFTSVVSSEGVSKPIVVDISSAKAFAPSAFSINTFSGVHYLQLLYSQQSLYVLNLETGKHATTKLPTLIPNLDPQIEVRFLSAEVTLLGRAIVGNSAGQRWIVKIADTSKVQLEMVFEKGVALGANCDLSSCQLLALEGSTASLYEVRPESKFPDTPVQEWRNAAPVASSNVAPMDTMWFWSGAKKALHMVVMRGDWSISSIDHEGKLQWRRLDGLSNIQSATFVDLLPTLHSSVSSDSTLLQRLRERFETQLEDAIAFGKSLATIHHDILDQARALLPSHKMAKASPAVLAPEDLLKKDRFGMHQMIVLVTGMGNTLVGLHTVGGRVVWERHFGDLDFLEYSVTLRRSVSLHPELFITGVDNYGFPVHFTINPLTGDVVSPISGLPFGVSQVFALEHLLDSEDRHPIIIIDMDNAPHVFPETESMHKFVKSQPKELLNFYLASRSQGSLSGFILAPSDELEAENPFKSVSSWSIKFGDPIYAMQAAHVHTHSAARVNPLDKTLALRHLNPNLVAVATLKFVPAVVKEDSEEAAPATPAKGTNYVQVAIIDTVSGAILHRASHKDCAAPIQLVFSENWVTYQYWNEKTHRYEVATLELFDKNGSWGAYV